MIILRNKEFSSREEDNKNLLVSGVLVPGGVVVGKISENLSEKEARKFESDLISGLEEKLNPELKERLKEEIRKSGTELRDNGGIFSEDEYFPRQSSNRIKKKFLNYKKRKLEKKLNNTKGAIPRYGVEMKLKEIDDILSGGNIINVRKSSNSSTIAHEFGHAKIDKSKKLINKVIKNADQYGKVYNKMSPLIGISAGIVSGYNNEESGQGNLVLDNYHIISPTISNTAIIVNEAKASKEGLKELKRLGANPKILKASKKSLRHALGTYVYEGAKNVGYSLAAGEGGKVLGRLAAKITKNKKEKKDDSNT